MFVWVGQNLVPETIILSLDKVISLCCPQMASGTQIDQFLVTRAICSLVGDNGQIGVELLAELSNLSGVIVHVSGQELFGFVRISNPILGDGVVECSFLTDLRFILKPVLQQSEFASLLELVDKVRNGTVSD